MRDAIAHLSQFVGNDIGVLSVLHNLSSSSFHFREVNMFLSRRVALQMWLSLWAFSIRFDVEVAGVMG